MGGAFIGSVVFSTVATLFILLFAVLGEMVPPLTFQTSCRFPLRFFRVTPPVAYV